MCEYCYHSPHLSGCPNAPEAIPIHVCKNCGYGIFPGDQYHESYTGPLCKECLDNMSAVELLKYEEEDLKTAEIDYDQ